MKQVQKITLLLFVVLLAAGCKKNTVFLYDVNPVEVSNTGSNKPNVKTDDEFISIAYSDMFGATIPQAELEELALTYRSYGDKRLIIDMIIRNFINSTTAVLPSDTDMHSDPGAFVENAYKKFYVREPNEFEKWFVTNQIETDTAVSAASIYYAFMTSNEYRFY